MPSIDLAVGRDDVAGLDQHDVARPRARGSRPARSRRASRRRGAWPRSPPACARSASARALPRPSAIASAKFAKSTVNQSQTAIWPISAAPAPPATQVAQERRASPAPPRPRPRTSPGCATSARGSSLPNATRARLQRDPRSSSDRRPSLRERSAWTCDLAIIMGLLRRSWPASIAKCSAIGPSASAGKKVSAADDQDHRDEQRHEQRRRAVGKVPAEAGDGLLGGEAAGDREHRHDEGEAAEQHGDALAACCGTACWRRSRRRPSRCCRSPRCRRRGSRTGRAARGPGPRPTRRRQRPPRGRRRRARRPASTRKASTASLTSRASIFLPRYSGVRPTISPAMNTVSTTNSSMP